MDFKVKQLLPAIALILVVTGPVHAADKWLCIVDQSVGFRYDPQTKEWQRGFFKSGRKFLISATDEATKEKYRHLPNIADSKYVIRDFGEDHPTWGCQSFQSYGWLENCNGIGSFFFNLSSLEFMEIYPVGYPSTKEAEEEFKSGNTPNMSIGKCSPF